MSAEAVATATSYVSDANVAAGQLPEKNVAINFRTQEKELRKSEYEKLHVN